MRTTCVDFPAAEIDPDSPYDSIRTLYLHTEPGLLACIRNGDRRGATKCINLLLVHIYSIGAEHGGYLKGLLLELVVMMSRAAVEQGVPHTKILGMGYQKLTELAAVEDDEALAAWLRTAVVSIFDAVDSRRSSPPPNPVRKLLEAIRKNPGADWESAAAAKAAGLSASRLARVLRVETGRSLGETVRAVRLEAACDLLARTDLSIAEIAATCGFCDQSYFTNVFREDRKVTPRAFRAALRKSPGISPPPEE